MRGGDFQFAGIAGFQPRLGLLGDPLANGQCLLAHLHAVGGQLQIRVGLACIANEVEGQLRELGGARSFSAAAALRRSGRSQIDSSGKSTRYLNGLSVGPVVDELGIRKQSGLDEIGLGQIEFDEESWKRALFQRASTTA